MNLNEHSKKKKIGDASSPITKPRKCKGLAKMQEVQNNKLGNQEFGEVI